MEELYANILAHVAEAVISINEKQQIVFLNRSAATLLGCEPEAVYGKPLTSVMPTYLSERHQAHMNKLMTPPENQSDQIRTIVNGRRVNGTPFIAAASFSQFRYQDELITTVLLTDITEQQQATTRLRQLSRVIEQSPDAIVITDLDGRIDYANPRFLELTGYTLAEVQGQNPRFLKSGNTKPETYDNLWQTITSGETWQGEFQNKRKDGTLYWVSASIAPVFDENGRICNYFAVEEDSTLHKQTEDDLIQRNRELVLLNRAARSLNASLDLNHVLSNLLEESRKLLNVVACSVWLIDNETNELVCQQMTDPHASTVIGWRLPPGVGIAGWVVDHKQSLVVPDTRKDNRHFRDIDEATNVPLRSILTVPLLLKDEAIGVIQVVDVMPDRFMESDLLLVESLAAAAAGAIDNARLFAQLRDTQAQLIQRERLAALGQMSATVVHELRNPLMAIRIGVDYLLRDVPADDPRQRGATLMQGNIRRIDRIMEDILFVSRTQQASLVPGLLPPLIHEEVARWQLALDEKDLTLTTEIEPDSHLVLLDSEQMSRALTNLIGNSVDVLPSGGNMVLRLCRDGRSQLIQFIDNGPGIAPGNMAHIFEPFFTTKARGTGLGLAIVKQIIAAHNGEISVASNLGEGTIFTIRLPAVQETQEIP